MHGTGAVGQPHVKPRRETTARTAKDRTSASQRGYSTGNNAVLDFLNTLLRYCDVQMTATLKQHCKTCEIPPTSATKQPIKLTSVALTPDHSTIEAAVVHALETAAANVTMHYVSNSTPVREINSSALLAHMCCHLQCRRCSQPLTRQLTVHLPSVLFVTAAAGAGGDLPVRCNVGNAAYVRQYNKPGVAVYG